MSWSRRFEEPIELPDGRRLMTLAEAMAIFAQMGMLHQKREFNPDRKDTHWGKRKLKKDL